MQLETYRIVVLQKEPENISRLEKIFGREQFEVSSFSDQRKLLQYVRMQPAPQSVITDLEVSDGETFDILERIRRDARWKDVPIMVLAPSVDKERLMKLQELKINNYMVRPFKPSKLFTDVLAMMGLEVVTQKRPVKRAKSGG